MVQLRPTHLLSGASGVLDDLKGALSSAKSSLTLNRLSVTVRKPLAATQLKPTGFKQMLTCRRRIKNSGSHSSNQQYFRCQPCASNGLS